MPIISTRLRLTFYRLFPVLRFSLRITAIAAIMLQDNFHKTMSKENITFRIDSDRKAALDAIAARINHDRSYVLNEAVAASDFFR
ncbi:MAG: hypothetical protein V7K57_07205 [Nostoc sp.]